MLGFEGFGDGDGGDKQGQVREVYVCDEYGRWCSAGVRGGR